MSKIEFLRVSKRFEGGGEALKDVSLVFPEGTMTFLTGHSGAGKSTFLRLLLRAESPTRGEVLVNDVSVVKLPSRKISAYRQNLGAGFQDHHLLTERSVYENVALPLKVAGMRERDIGRRVRAALSRVGLLEKERFGTRALSSGEQQRIGIARAIVNRPKVLLADEPTRNLDPGLSRDIMTLFEQFNQIGTTVIVASHDTELIGVMGFRIIELARGRVVRDDDATGLKERKGSGG